MNGYLDLFPKALKEPSTARIIPQYLCGKQHFKAFLALYRTDKTVPDVGIF